MFKEMNVKDFGWNSITGFGNDWAALTAGNEEKGYNAMTIAWGQIGSLWEIGTHANRLPVATVYVRPQRYTKEFMDKEEYFTISSFGPSGKKILGVLGSRSGRDTDKIKDAGLHPVFEKDYTYYEEAELVIVCRKMYSAPLTESGFADKDVMEFNYPKRDFHEMYIGEIVKVLKKDETI